MKKVQEDGEEKERHDHDVDGLLWKRMNLRGERV